MLPPTDHPEASLYRSNAARITTREVLHESEKEARIRASSRLKRRKARQELAAEWEAEERLAQEEARGVVQVIGDSVEALNEALGRLAELDVPGLMGKVETEQQRVRLASGHVEDALEALEALEFGDAGAATEEAERELWMVGTTLVVPLNEVLQQATVGKEHRFKLEENIAQRHEAKRRLEAMGEESSLEKLRATAQLRSLDAAGLGLAADILAGQVRLPSGHAEASRVGREGELRVVPPQECETFEDVGGLEDVKEHLASTIGAILERPDEAAKYHVVHNGVLFHGPPGTGKNLLSRALAGEYGMRYIRFSPSAIASAYIHEAASNLRRLFELAKDNVPCLLFLDEIDTIASARSDQPSADHREVVTQLMVCLEEYRTVPGLVIAAATNDLDRLDPALREGRFDAKILVPLPDPPARKDIFSVHLARRGEALDQESLDLDELARLTGGYNAAAIESVVSVASQAALRDSVPIGQEHLVVAVRERGGKDRQRLDEEISWDDVVLADQTRQQLMEILEIFSDADLASDLGVSVPAGVVLYGPPGTGKTTIAKAMASQIQASFYEQSAADLMSKWAGESEQRVAKLFERARANRPSIIFVDELDALLRRRSADSNTKWEERVLSQFLRELDGLRGGDGVLLVGATNRVDAIDEAIVGRRLEPIEVGLPDPTGRLQLLTLLTREVKLAKDVDLRKLASLTEGLSGADLKNLRNAAGRKAMSRASANGKDRSGAAVTMADFQAALDARLNHASLVEM